MTPQPAQGLAEPKPRHTDDNYAYWREHGASWVQEYTQRKRTQVYYHIQEVMLADYVQHSALIAQGARGDGPLRVLEFGCGVGRHLANLSRLPGIDAHGYDQSPTMVQGCLRWTGQDWMDQHIRVGPPVGRLPYADASFDIVYTSEVLIHVRPEHLSGILAELVRVAKWQVLHFEPAEHTPISTDSHDGCWRHDLPAAYSALGATCETLPSGFRLQAPYRVMLGGPAPFTWSAVLLDMYRRLDRDIDAGFDELRERLRAQTTLASTLDARLSDAHREALRAQESHKALQAQLAAAEARARDHAAIASTREEAAKAAARAEAAAIFAREITSLQGEHAAKLASLSAAVASAELARDKALADLATIRQELADAALISGQSVERANSLALEVQRLTAERRATIQELQRLLSK